MIFNKIKRLPKIAKALILGALVIAVLMVVPLSGGLLISSYPDTISNREMLEKQHLELLPKSFSRMQLMQTIDKVSQGTSWAVK